MKLTKTENKIFNKSGRLIAEIKEGKIHIAQKDFRRAVRKIRELLNQDSYNFLIV